MLVPRLLQARRPAGQPPSYRSFDPVRLGLLERDAWAAYYLRDWFRLLRVSVLMVRVGFGMSWPRTLYGAWLVLRANQFWAPFPDNDTDAAVRVMRRFYALVAEAFDADLDAGEAARLEVEWWRAHRYAQRIDPEHGYSEVVTTLTDLYAFVYALDSAAVRPVAQERASALELSDRWVREGCQPGSVLLGEEGAALVRCYATLLAVVHR
jgi:hypothetical protein